MIPKLAKILGILIVLGVIGLIGFLVFFQVYETSAAKRKLEAMQVPLSIDALVDAARAGNDERLQLFLGTRRIPIDAKDATGSTALIGAVAAGQQRAVQLLIEQGRAGVDENDKAGATALMIAAGAGHIGIMKYLLEQGAQPGKKDEQGLTALMIAASRDQLPAVMELLAHGSDPTARNRDGQTVCTIALEAKATAVLRYLVAQEKCAATPATAGLIDPPAPPLAAPIAAPIAAPSPQAIIDACLQEAKLTKAKPVGTPMSFAAGVGYDALLISGQYPKADKKNAKEMVLCLFNRATGTAVISTTATPAPR